MSARVTPQLDDQIAEAVDDGGVRTEVRRAVHVADGADPLRHTVEVAKLSLQGRRDGEGGQTRVSVKVSPGPVDEPLIVPSTWPLPVFPRTIVTAW